MKINKNYLLVILVIFVLVHSVSYTATAHSEGETEIDISNGYTSSTIALEWQENASYGFTIDTPTNYTLELLNLNSTLFFYEIEVDSVAALHLRHGDEATNDPNLTADGYPEGHHVSDYVKRQVNFDEAGNFTLILSNDHDHQADGIQFSFKFTKGFTGDEVLGLAAEGNTSNSPILVMPIVLMTLSAMIISKRVIDTRQKKV